MEKYMEIALKQAKKASLHGDVPIGCIIVKDDKIISKAYNKKQKRNISTDHAEIIAIRKACKKLKNWRLLGCTLYCTMEPCKMCLGAIEQSRIEQIVYGVPNSQFGGITKKDDQLKMKIVSNVCEEECKKLVQDFFKEKRK